MSSGIINLIVLSEIHLYNTVIVTLTNALLQELRRFHTISTMLLFEELSLSVQKLSC